MPELVCVNSPYPVLCLLPVTLCAMPGLVVILLCKSRFHTHTHTHTTPRCAPRQRGPRWPGFPSPYSAEIVIMSYVSPTVAKGSTNGNAISFLLQVEKLRPEDARDISCRWRPPASLGSLQPSPSSNGLWQHPPRAVSTRWGSGSALSACHRRAASVLRTR